MIVKIGLAVSLSVAVYVLTQLRSKPASRSNPAREPRYLIRGIQENNVEINKQICSYSKADSTQKNYQQEEEVKRIDSLRSSLSNQSFNDDEQLLLPEFSDLISEEMPFPSQDAESSKTVQNGDKDKQSMEIDSDLMPKNDGHMYAEAMTNASDEIERLRALVQELQKREESYENELLEYYGLKEQEASIVELERRLKLNGVEIEMLKLKINTLEAQKKKIEEELVEASLVNKELECARSIIEELQRQIQMDFKESNEQLHMLQQRITVLEVKEKDASEKNFQLEKKLQTLKELEVEVVELRRANKELQQEKRELMVKLDFAEAKIASLSKITETEVIEKAREEVNFLRHENKDLSKQIEGLQNNRFSEVEALVYLRWVNACLRYELRNYKAPPGKVTARDLNKSLSPRSQEKAKQLMFEYAGPDVFTLREKEFTDNDFETASSRTSTPSDSGDFDDFSLDSVSSRQTRSKKSSLIHKLKRWGRSKDDSLASLGGSSGDRRGNGPMTWKKSPQHRYSMSSVPSETVLSRNSSNGGSIDSVRREVDSDTRLWSKSSTLLDAHDIATKFLEAHGVEMPSLDSSEMDKSNMSETSPEMKNSSNSVADSLRFVSKSAAGIHEGEKPGSKDRHWLALQRENAIKGKAEQHRMRKKSEKNKIESLTENVRPEKLTGKKILEALEFRDCQTNSPCDHPSQQPEISKMKLAEVQKRAPKVAKAPPKPSMGSPTHNGISIKASSDVRMPAPPSLPPSKSTAAVGMPPPPPPPPNSLQDLQRQTGEKVHRVPQVVEFYQSLVKREVQKEVTNVTSATSSNVADAHNNIIGELENRSAYLLAVKADVETQGDFVQSLANEVRVAIYTNIKDVVDFVHWLDEELSFLVDELAVLKHFDWPESKVDVLREAAFEYQDLQKLESEVASFVDSPTLSCDTALNRMLSLLEQVEKSVYGLLRTRDMVIARYKEFNIPTNWLLDSGLLGKIKLTCVQLAQKYMKRVISELDAIATVPEKEPIREFLLLQGVRFAFRVHQFAGGFDAPSMETFEDLRKRAQGQAKDAS
ncbi:protein CHUP1, chloroplastic isoform X1 [Cryptomeria japonica]|uniref:protein CHUP1, chloroplastic isoform X1 n=1 Tax=Cryptomeria japonica TaxID=3369 RepID=UPI0027DA49FA|nr:protein CHUP1, chloroplastic isoform X1 [Cryptomeria japonica]XP_057831273.2 protein CHUP1, chloroplastic isoform X1 [Cryptomeria japonica]XP_057831274.2 protein CHUP1, chloroplastic isoform X1 [Cryptomeria japonica]